MKIVLLNQKQVFSTIISIDHQESDRTCSFLSSLEEKSEIREEARTSKGEKERTIKVRRQLSANAMANPPTAVAGGKRAEPEIELGCKRDARS